MRVYRTLAENKEYAFVFDVRAQWLDEQCHTEHSTLGVTECCSLDWPCRTENFSSVMPSPNPLTVCVKLFAQVKRIQLGFALNLWEVCSCISCRLIKS